jgi:hypothetical protein
VSYSNWAEAEGDGAVVIDNPLTYLVGLAALDWQLAALFCLAMCSNLVIYRRHLSPAAILNRRQRVERELRQRRYGRRCNHRQHTRLSR